MFEVDFQNSQHIEVQTEKHRDCRKVPYIKAQTFEIITKIDAFFSLVHLYVHVFHIPIKIQKESVFGKYCRKGKSKIPTSFSRCLYIQRL